MMFDLPIWSLWLIAAGVLLIAEIFTGSFFLICFSLAAAVSSALSGLGFDLGVQWIAFLVVSFIAGAYVKKFASRITPEDTRPACVDRMLDGKGVVIQRIDPAAGSGKVRINHEEWRAKTDDAATIEEGETVVVNEVRGSHLVVKKL